MAMNYYGDGGEDDRSGYKRSRRRDPETSKRAIAGSKARAIREAIIKVMRDAGKPMTAEAINRLVPVNGQSGNPRYNELMEEGSICTDGGRGKNLSGKEAVLWRLTTPREGVFLRERSKGGFPVTDALAIAIEEAPPEVADRVWAAFDGNMRKAYRGYFRKEDWERFKKEGIEKYMRAYGEDRS